MKEQKCKFKIVKKPTQSCSLEQHDVSKKPLVIDLQCILKSAVNENISYKYNIFLEKGLYKECNT